MPLRKIPLVEEKIYHIYTKSIAGFQIFNSDRDYERMLGAIAFYLVKDPPCKFSLFLQRKRESGKVESAQQSCSSKIVKILAYCLMPTHIHILLQQLEGKGISQFLNLILKSYSKYFNIKYKRKGPLWEGRFENVLVETDEQLLHLTRYIHLNPVTAFIVNDPKDWKFSSYSEYINLTEKSKRICDFSDCIDMDVYSYEKFTLDQADYQRELSFVKELALE